jgi:hypothetical protein
MGKRPLHITRLQCGWTGTFLVVNPQEKTMKSKPPAKHPEKMSAAELARATKGFDRPFIYQKARPMTPTERAQERQLRGPGRPKKGRGSRKVSISLEGELLDRTDALARKHGMHRSELIARFVAAGLLRKAS